MADAARYGPSILRRKILGPFPETAGAAIDAPERLVTRMPAGPGTIWKARGWAFGIASQGLGTAKLGFLVYIQAIPARRAKLHSATTVLTIFYS